MSIRKVEIHIECENAAFQEHPGIEVARLLREAADKCSEGLTMAPEARLRDSNGNTVGYIEIF